MMRPYPAGGWGREMGGNDHDGAIRESLKEALPGCSRHLRIDAETAVEPRFGALQRRMHDIAAEDRRSAPRSYDNADMTGCVPRSRLDPDIVINSIVCGDQLGLTTVHDRQ